MPVASHAPWLRVAFGELARLERVRRCCGARNAGAYLQTGAGWCGYIADDPDEDEPPVVATYCPPCAKKHFGAKPRDHDYT
jgi:hypothetical protein